MLPSSAHELKQSTVLCKEQRTQCCVGPVMLGMTQVTLKASRAIRSYVRSPGLYLVMLGGPYARAPTGVCSVQGFNPWTNANPANLIYHKIVV